jgi:chromatin remodeling complex protein RSC6
MPPRTSQSTTKSTTVKATEPAVAEPVKVVAAEPAKVVATETAKPARKRATATKVEELVVAEPVVATETVVATDDSAAVKERAAPPTVESVQAEFTELVTVLEQQIAQLRDSSDKTGSLKFLRGILRRAKSLQSNSTRVLRRKQPVKRANNTNSGFLKPVKISADIAKFTGLNPVDLHSRVDVTKYLCDYIKEHNLQNPEDKRQIVADPALSKLLGYDAKKAGVPLTYYRIQSLLKPHFISEKKAE